MKIHNMNDLKAFLEAAENSFKGMTISSQTARDALNAIEKYERSYKELENKILVITNTIDFPN